MSTTKGGSLNLPFTAEAKATRYGTLDATDDDAPYDAEGATKVSIAIDGGNATLFSSFSNLGTGALGVGILSYPFAFSSAGIVPTILSTLFFALINLYTISLVSRFAQRHARALRLRTYEELVNAAIGRRAYGLAVFSVWGISIGALTGYFIILGDLATPVIEHWFNHDETTFYASRTFLVIVVGAAIIFPLSLGRDIHALAVTSAIAILSIVAVVVVLAVRGGQYVADNGGVHESVKVVHAGTGIVTSMPLCIFALCCHLQVVPVFTELPLPKRARFSRVSISTIVMCSSLYIASGIFGYILFGEDVKGDVLASFSPSDTVANVAKVLMVVHVVLAYPVALFPVRKAIDVLLLHTGGHQPTFTRTIIQNIGVIALTGVLAVAFPRIEKVFDIVGATTGVMITIIFPAWMLLKNKPAEDFGTEAEPIVTAERASLITTVDSTDGISYAVTDVDSKHRQKAIVLLVVGAVTGVVCLGVNIYSFM